MSRTVPIQASGKQQGEESGVKIVFRDHEHSNIYDDATDENNLQRSLSTKDPSSLGSVNQASNSNQTCHSSTAKVPHPATTAVKFDLWPRSPCSDGTNDDDSTYYTALRFSHDFLEEGDDDKDLATSPPLCSNVRSPVNLELIDIIKLMKTESTDTLGDEDDFSLPSSGGATLDGKGSSQDVVHQQDMQKLLLERND